MKYLLYRRILFTIFALLAYLLVQLPLNGRAER